MKRSEMEREMLALLRRPGAYLVLPADMTLEQAAEMHPEHLLTALVEDRKPKEGWDPEGEWRLPDSIVATRVVDCDGLHLLPKTPGRPLTDDQVRRIYEAACAAYNSENRYMRVAEEALTEIRSAAPSLERVLAILEEREIDEPEKARGSFRSNDPLDAPPEVVAAYENLRKFFFGSGV